MKRLLEEIADKEGASRPATTTEAREKMEEPPDIVIELRDRSGKLKSASNGKYDIIGKKTDFLRYCAISGYIDDFTFTKDIFNRWINHNYTQQSLDKIWRAAIKYAEKTDKKNMEVYSKVHAVADMIDKTKKCFHTER
jgi:hypothetical protein